MRLKRLKSHERVRRSNHLCGFYCLLHCVGYVYHFVDLAMMYALASLVIAIRVGWRYSQEWLSGKRVLQYCHVSAQPVRAPSAALNMADKQCAPLQKSGLGGYLEQRASMGWNSRFGRNKKQNNSRLSRCN